MFQCFNIPFCVKNNRSSDYKKENPRSKTKKGISEKIKSKNINSKNKDSKKTSINKAY